MKKLILHGLFLMSSYSSAVFAQSPCPPIMQNFVVSANQQIQSTPLDILMVIDNSASMNPYQIALTQQIDSITHELNSVGLDFNIAITTTDSKVSMTGLSYPKLNSDYSKTDKEGFRSLFLKTAKVGISGSSKEAGLDAVKNFLEQEGTAFLRPNSQFLILTLSDTDDSEHSIVSVNELSQLILKYKNKNQVHVFNFIGNHGEHYSQLRESFQGRDYLVLNTPYLREARLNQKKGEKFLQTEFEQLAKGISRTVPKDFVFKLSNFPNPENPALKVSLKSRPFLPVEKYSLDTEGNLSLTLLLERADEVRVFYQPICSIKQKSFTPENLSSKEPADIVGKLVDQVLGELQNYKQDKEDSVNVKIPEIQKLSPAQQKKFILNQYEEYKLGERSLRTELSKKFIALLDMQANLYKLDESISYLERMNEQPKEAISLGNPVYALQKFNQKIKDEEKAVYFILDTSGSMNDTLKDIQGEFFSLLSSLKPEQKFNIATVTDSGLKTIYEVPTHWSEQNKATVRSFFQTPNGISNIASAIEDATSSGLYGTIVVISDSLLFDEAIFLQQSKFIQIPIYSLITLPTDFLKNPSLQSYQRAYIEKINHEIFTSKRELTALKLAKNKKELGVDLMAEAQKARSLLIKNNKIDSFASVEMEIYDRVSRSTVEETDSRISELELKIAQLNNVITPKKTRPLTSGLSTQCESLYIPLAIASCNSGGESLLVDPNNAIFTAARELDLIRKLNTKDNVENQSRLDQEKLEQLKQQRQELIKTMNQHLLNN